MSFLDDCDLWLLRIYSQVMTQFNATTYDIERPTGRCAFTDRELIPGEPYFATLVELTDEQIEQARQQAEKQGAKPQPETSLGLKRLDVCQEKWQEGARPEQLFSYWKSTVPEPNEKKKMFVDDAVLMNLLRRLEDTEDEQRLAFRYVLALILMRKKLLRYDGVETIGSGDEAKVYWNLTPKKDLSKGPLGKWNEDETLRVLDPQLDESRIEEVTEQLGEILEGDL